MLQKRRKALLGILIILNFFVFLTIVTFTSHTIVTTSAKDICLEVDYQGGMFDLWQQLALSAFSQINNVTSGLITSLAAQGCTQYQDLCNSMSTNSSIPFQICGYYDCNSNLYPNVGNFTLIDNGGVPVKVKDCPQVCTNPTLKSYTQQYTNIFLPLYQQYLSLIAALEMLLQGVASETTRTLLHALICKDLSQALTVVYTGCGFLLAGELILIFFFFMWGW